MEKKKEERSHEKRVEKKKEENGEEAYDWFAAADDAVRLLEHLDDHEPLGLAHEAVLLLARDLAAHLLLHGRLEMGRAHRDAKVLDGEHAHLEPELLERLQGAGRRAARQPLSVLAIPHKA